LKYFFKFYYQAHIPIRKYNKNPFISFCIFFLLITHIGFPQSHESDSLQNVITNDKDDNLKVDALISLAQANRESEPQKALEYAVRAKDLALTLGYSKGLGYGV
jgi:hypothetical protein